MKWTVLSHRMAWDAGTVLTEADLVGCNIDALVQGGHLAPADMKTNKQPSSRTNKIIALTSSSKFTTNMGS